MLFGQAFRSASALVLAAAAVTGLSPAQAKPAAADDSDGPRFTVLDPTAEAAIAADLKTRARKLVVTRFSVEADASSRSGDAPSHGCTGAPAVASGAAAALDPKIVDSIGAQLSKRLARHVAMATETSVDAAPLRSVVVTGCITRFEAGNAVKRWAGFHYGASRIGAHVRVNEKLARGLKPVAEFDVAVTGASLLPPLSPIGVAVHAATMNSQTLAASARKLGNRVAYAIEDNLLPRED